MQQEGGKTSTAARERSGLRRVSAESGPGRTLDPTTPSCGVRMPGPEGRSLGQGSCISRVRFGSVVAPWGCRRPRRPGLRPFAGRIALPASHPWGGGSGTGTRCCVGAGDWVLRGRGGIRGQAGTACSVTPGASTCGLGLRTAGRERQHVRGRP